MAGFNETLGLMPGDGEATVVLDTRPDHEVVPGTIHFAVLATLAEVSAARAVDAAVVPTNLSLALISRARPGRLEARGRLIKRGRRLAFAEGEVTQDGAIVAKASVTVALLS
jgi:acyl-coenzyme A thioesterase PaaI-like protein